MTPIPKLVNLKSWRNLDLNNLFQDAELQPWGSIKYHEFENPLGSTLLANCSKVNIVNSINDVQQNSFEQIFQLQDIFNINRSKDSIDAQKNIGQGILIDFIITGNFVMMKNKNRFFLTFICDYKFRHFADVATRAPDFTE